MMVRRAASVTNRTILRTELGIAEAMAHRELGDRARAVTELTAIAAHPIEPLVYLQLLALLELVAMHIDDGDLTAAEQRFGEASALVADELRGAGAREWLARTGISLTLAVGDQHGARYWSEQIADPFWAGVGVARVALAGGDRAAAVSAVDATGSRCIRHEAIRELLLCRAVDDRDEAMKHATMAVELASTHGLLQTIASEDAETLELVERAAWRAPPEWLDRLRRAAGSGSVVRQRPRALGAALTERERDVLRFLPSRLTYREIASELYVSLNTLKFHLKIIYRKLGVGSRAEAAEIARQLALIPTHR